MRSDCGAYRWPPFTAEMQSSLVDRWLFRRVRPRVADLQVVVIGKIHTKIPGHDIVVTQGVVDDDALHVANRCRHTPGRIGDMATRTPSARTELAHDAGQPLRPIAGAEGFALLGHTQDVEFFGGGGIHIE